MTALAAATYAGEATLDLGLGHLGALGGAGFVDEVPHCHVVAAAGGVVGLHVRHLPPLLLPLLVRPENPPACNIPSCCVCKCAGSR